MSELQLLEITRRDECIKELRKHGLSIRQISRLTGISKGVIEKIGRQNRPLVIETFQATLSPMLVMLMCMIIGYIAKKSSIQTRVLFCRPVQLFSTAYLLTPVIRLICLIDNPPSFSVFMHLFRLAISSFQISDALPYPHTCFMISLASLSFILLF